MSPEAAARAPVALDVQMIPLEQLLESPMNTRRHYDAAAMTELEASIRQVGVLTPLIARPMYGVAQAEDQIFELAAGHRRYRAAKSAGVDAVPVRVMALDDDAFRHILIIENLQRQDIHPLDEADGYQALMKATGASADAIAGKVGKSTSYVYQRLKLLNLTADARAAFDRDEITPGHAVRLARLTPAQQGDALKECFHRLWDVEPGQKREPAPVSTLDRWIEAHVREVPTSADMPHYFPELEAQLASDPEAGTLLELSADHFVNKTLGTKEHGALAKGRWHEITGKSDRCKHLQRGVVVHGGPMRILEVCATKGCPKHFPVRKAPKAAARGEKAESYQERYKREDEERRLQAKAWDALYPRVQERLLAAAVEIGPKGSVLDIAVSNLRRAISHRKHDVFDRVIGKITVDNFIVATVAAAVAFPYGLDSAKGDAKRLGVDISDLEKEFKAAAVPPKAEKKPAPPKASTKAAKAKKRKAR